MDAAYVASSDETEDITVGLPFVAYGDSWLADEVTVEFAPGLRRRVMLGSPPPPPADLYEIRLGRLRPAAPRRNLLTPLVTVLLLVTAVAVGLNLRAGPADSASTAAPRSQSGPPVPVAATTAASPTSAAPTTRAGTTAAATNAPPSAPPTGAPLRADAGPAAMPVLTGIRTVPFGQDVALRAAGFPCRAGGRLTISVAGYFVATADTDAQGGAAVTVPVEAVAGRPGQVALSGTSDYLTLAPGNWVVRAEAAAQAGCTAEASAATTVTVNPPQ